MSFSILFLTSDLLQLGSGIARHGRFVCRALLAHGHVLQAIALTDPSAPSTRCAPPHPGLLYMPCGGSRLVFVRRAAVAAWQMQPDFVIADHVNLAPAAWLLARWKRAILITFIHGIDAIWPLTPARRFSLQRSDRVLAVSHFTASRSARANALSVEKMGVLYTCLDPELQSLPSEPTQPAGLSILTVGRLSLLEQYKGQDRVIRAMPALRQRFPTLVYDIVGDGDWRPALENLAAELGVVDAVRFHGFVSDQDLHHCYAQASVFIMPSQGEGFGIVFLEAMAHGLPVVAGNADASPEVIVDGVTGYLVDPTSVEDVTNALSRLLLDSDLRRSMGRAGLQRANQYFTFDGFQRSLLACLTQLKSKSDAG